MEKTRLYEINIRWSLMWVLTVTVVHLALPVTADESIVKMNAFGYVMEGMIAAFDCVDRQANKPVSVLRWEHNKQPIQSCDRARISPEGTYHKLLIRSIVLSDAGHYQCVAEINGTVYRANRMMSILARAIVMYPSNVTYAAVGTNVTLRCDGELYETILWSKNGNYLKADRIRVSHNGSEVSISNVTWADSGTYKCTYSASGRRVVSQAVQLVVVDASSHTTTSYTWHIPTSTSTQQPSFASVVTSAGSSTPTMTSRESTSSTRVSPSRSRVAVSSSVSFRTRNGIDSSSSSTAMPTTSSSQPLTTSTNPNSLATQAVSEVSSVTSILPSLTYSSSKDKYEVSPWMMAVLVVCATFGVLGLLLAGISFCRCHRTRRNPTRHSKSRQSKHRLNITNPTYSLSRVHEEDSAQRSDAITNCSTGFGQHDAVVQDGDRDENHRKPQPRPDRDSCGYVIVKGCCRGAGTSNGSTVPATATGYMSMASNPTNTGNDGVGTCKRCGSSRSPYANVDQSHV